MVAELRVQPLEIRRRRAYRDKYASRGFHAFAGGESFDVAVRPGAYACTFRFVRAEPGQESALVELGVVVMV